MAPKRSASLTTSLVALLLGAVGGGCAPASDEDLFGVVLEVESTRPFVYQPDFRRRLHRVLAESCAHVGVDPSRLYGMRLRIVDGGIPCAEYDDARGCTLSDASEMAVSTLAWISTSPPVDCIEDTPLPHEILHLRIADGAHADPRWGSDAFWEPLRRSLARPECSGEAATRLW